MMSLDLDYVIIQLVIYSYTYNDNTKVKFNNIKPEKYKHISNEKTDIDKSKVKI